MIYKIISVFLILFQLNIGSNNSITGKVVKIVDGDTFDVLTTNNQTTRIRMHGIDCPEKGQDYYKVCKQQLANYIFNKVVYIETKGLDRYKRTIGDVYVKNTFINLQMIVDGCAWHSTEFDKSVEMANAELQAKNLQKGLWAQKDAIAPWAFRKNKKRTTKQRQLQ